MDDDDFRDQIAQLEARSEALAESIERCRKISLAAKLTIAAGAIWIVLAAAVGDPVHPRAPSSPRWRP